MLTLQGLMRQWGEDGLVRFRPWFNAEALKLIDIVVYSQEDVEQYPQLTDRVRDVSKHLIVTNGRNGGTYYTSGREIRYSSLDVYPLDLTGAGDVFAASLLGVLPMINNDVRKAVSIAGRLAAYSVTRSGVDSAPTSDEIACEVKRFQGE